MNGSVAGLLRTFYSCIHGDVTFAGCHQAGSNAVAPKSSAGVSHGGSTAERNTASGPLVLISIAER